MTRTDWQIQPSFCFDTLCLLNTLTGDPFYVEFNQVAYDHFRLLLTPEAETALAHLRRIIKDEGQGIISAMLCLFYSAVEVETLADMQRTLDDPSAMLAGLQASPYYDESEWQRFLSCVDDLRVIFRFLEAINFPDYWQETILPGLQEDIQHVAAYLADYDVVAQLEAMIGYTLPSPTITVYVLHYTRPHGIKIIGQRFITAATWGAPVVLRTAIHEMLHPPYDLHTDTALRAAMMRLQDDPFIADKFAHHNPDYGYNEFTGYVEENCVRALDQIVSEAFEIARNPHERWRTEDGGMHVLAASLYHLLKTGQFTSGFRDFLLIALNTHLAPGKVRAVYDAFYATEAEA